MSAITTAISVLAGPVLSIFKKRSTDKDKVLEAQAEIRKRELEDSPKSYLKLWSCFIGWVLGFYLAFALIIRPFLVFYFPTIPVPETPLDEGVMTLLMGMMGLAI